MRCSLHSGGSKWIANHSQVWWRKVRGHDKPRLMGVASHPLSRWHRRNASCFFWMWKRLNNSKWMSSFVKWRNRPSPPLWSFSDEDRCQKDVHCETTVFFSMPQEIPRIKCHHEKSTSFVGLCCCKLLPIWNLRVYLGARRMAVAVAKQDTSPTIYRLDWPKTQHDIIFEARKHVFFPNNPFLVSMRDFEEYHVMLVVSCCVDLQRCLVITRLSLQKFYIKPESSNLY